MSHKESTSSCPFLGSFSNEYTMLYTIVHIYHSRPFSHVSILGFATAVAAATRASNQGY